jgi:hypothetical protein
MQLTYPLKIQAIRSQGQQPRLYVSFPLALAAAIGLNPGDQVAMGIASRQDKPWERGTREGVKLSKRTQWAWKSPPGKAGQPPEASFA